MGWSSNYTQGRRVPILQSDSPNCASLSWHGTFDSSSIAASLIWDCNDLVVRVGDGQREQNAGEPSLVVSLKFRPWWMFTLKLKLMNLDEYISLTRMDTESSSFASFGKFFGSFRLKLGSTHPHINSGWWQLKYFLYFHPYVGKMILFDSYFSNGLKPPTSNLFSVMD